MNIFGYNRIIIVGNNGNGKSFLSKELSVILGLPLVHLDVEFWRPNWEMPPKEEWIKKQTELISKEKRKSYRRNVSDWCNYRGLYKFFYT